jgi:DNA-binding NarL/FixJ family response regulator
MKDEMHIRVLSVDDHALLREAIAMIINHQSDMVLVPQACYGREAIQLYREHRPDVTLMDLRLPDLCGIDTLMAIRAEFPEARVIMLTTFEADAEIQRSLEAGASGYLLKSTPPSGIANAIREVHAGRRPFPRS